MNSFLNILRTKKLLKQSSFALNDGNYYFSDSFFSSRQSDFHFPFYKRLLRAFSIHSKHKFDYPIDSGSFFITPYKCVLLGKKKAFYFFRESNNYLKTKNKIAKYCPKICMKTMSITFFDSESLIVGDIVDGVQYKDETHFRMFLDHLFTMCEISIDSTTIKRIEELQSDIYFAPQHGDCHLGNVFWKDSDITMIDLDDVDEYPLFYDIFYLSLSFYHQNAFTLFKEAFFKNKIHNISDKLCLNYDDTVDKYLAAYLYFWINQMNKNIRYFDIYFYVRWFEKADLSDYPLTKKALGKYFDNLNLYKIRHE